MGRGGHEKTKFYWVEPMPSWRSFSNFSGPLLLTGTACILRFFISSCQDNPPGHFRDECLERGLFITAQEKSADGVRYAWPNRTRNRLGIDVFPVPRAESAPRPHIPRFGEPVYSKT